MNKHKLGRIALGVVGLAIGVVVVLLLREATLSTHEEVVGASEVELVVSADTNGAEATQTLPEMVEAQILTCRLEVNVDVEGPIVSLGDDRFRAVLVPAMDETDRRQFRGCLEDWIVDHLLLDVEELEVR